VEGSRNKQCQNVNSNHKATSEQKQDTKTFTICPLKTTSEKNSRTYNKHLDWKEEGIEILTWPTNLFFQPLDGFTLYLWTAETMQLRHLRCAKVKLPLPSAECALPGSRRKLQQVLSRFLRNWKRKVVLSVLIVPCYERPQVLQVIDWKRRSVWCSALWTNSM